MHAWSKRASQAFESMNAASVASSVIDSELFGLAGNYLERNAPARSGVIASADKGTFFLDEIGDCSHETQTRLLRVLENGELRGWETVRLARSM
jgi:transcriptional regulator of aroF, aroG, tyrA and aromatic amino acid transport